MQELKVMQVLPGDVLLIANVGQSGSPEMVRQLKADLPTVKRVVLFSGDVDVSVLREVKSDG
jgi:hypothetical protein